MKKLEVSEEYLREQFEMCYKTYLNKVTFYAYNYLNNMEEATDVGHEVFRTIWERRKFIDFGMDMFPFLLVITRNRCLNNLKQQQREWKYKQKTTLDYEKKLINLKVLSESNYSQLYSSEIEGLVDQAYAEMPKQVRDTYIMHRYHELTYSDIAKQEQISVKAVEKRMMIALKILRCKLKDYLEKQ